MATMAMFIALGGGAYAVTLHKNSVNSSAIKNGQVKTADTICYDILREILREARAFGEAREFRILASQPVIDRFLEEEAPSIEMLSSFIGRRISMQVESSYTQEQFDIVLM
jgi:ribonuclease G